MGLSQGKIIHTVRRRSVDDTGAIVCADEISGQDATDISLCR